jgi:hypothetical protein
MAQFQPADTRQCYQRAGISDDQLMNASEA